MDSVLIKPADPAVWQAYATLVGMHEDGAYAEVIDEEYVAPGSVVDRWLLWLLFRRG